MPYSAFFRIHTRQSRVAFAVFALLLATTNGSTQDAPAATYSEAVGPLVEAKCVHCHYPGGSAPMAFMSYAELRDWAKRSYTPLDALLRTRAMPPWPASPDVGEFSNAEFLTDAEIGLLLKWIEAGLPRGNGPYNAPAPPPEWPLGEPDHVITLPEYSVPEDVVGESRTVQLQTSFPEDRWIVATEVRPGNKYAVNAVDAGPLGAYQLGQSKTAYPAPYAYLLKKGATIDVTTHYLKEQGVEETDQTQIAVYFAKDVSGFKQLFNEPMRAEAFTIPAETADFEVEVSYTLPKDAKIVSIMPVMRTRGKRVTYTLISPDGSERTLLEIPDWNPNWKYRYMLRTPIAVPAGSVVTATAHFDNSEANLKNPDPWSDVPSGPAGEVFEGWLGYALAD